MRGKGWGYACVLIGAACFATLRHVCGSLLEADQVMGVAAVLIGILVLELRGAIHET